MWGNLWELPCFFEVCSMCWKGVHRFYGLPFKKVISVNVYSLKPIDFHLQDTIRCIVVPAPVMRRSMCLVNAPLAVCICLLIEMVEAVGLDNTRHLSGVRRRSLNQPRPFSWTKCRQHQQCQASWLWLSSRLRWKNCTLIHMPQVSCWFTCAELRCTQGSPSHSEMLPIHFGGEGAALLADSFAIPGPGCL